MVKETEFGRNLEANLLGWLALISSAARKTMGPGGDQVLIEAQGFPPRSTRSGHAVAHAKALEHPDIGEEQRLFLETVDRLWSGQGDGSTAAIVMANSLLEESMQYIAAGANPLSIRNGMGIAVSALVAEVYEKAWPAPSLREWEQVATTAADGDGPVGTLVAGYMDRWGPRSDYSIRLSVGGNPEMKVENGFRIGRGHSPGLAGDDAERGELILYDAGILLLKSPISHPTAPIRALEAMQNLGKPLLIITDGVDGEVGKILKNIANNSVRVAVVEIQNLEETADLLVDLQTFTGARTLSDFPEADRADFRPEHLGWAATVRLDREAAWIIGGRVRESSLSDLLGQLRKKLESVQDSEVERRLLKRIQRLTGISGILTVGAVTQFAAEERKVRTEKAMKAARSAYESGMVAGGGIALLRATRVLSNIRLQGDEALGMAMVRCAVEAPLRAIAENAGESPPDIVARALKSKGALGFNAATGSWEDLSETGIMDPAATCAGALESAASFAAAVLSNAALAVETDFGMEA